MSHRLLIVEDDEDLRLALTDNLEQEGYEISAVSTVADARSSLDSSEPDLILLDIMLPDGDGYTLCREIRSRSETPILMLTARSLEDDLIRGFDAGADDYLTKPYRLRELLARVRALVRRRSSAPSGETMQLDRFKIDTSARVVLDEAGAEIDFTPTEFDLLVFLYTERGRALSRTRILDEVWGRDVIVDGRTVDNFVSSLRRKLSWSEQSGFSIRTVRGVGYRMEVEDAEGTTK